MIGCGVSIMSVAVRHYTPALAIAGAPVAAAQGDSAAFAPTISGGYPPYTLSLLTGTLPTGRSLSGLSEVGTYSAAGTFSYTLRVTDGLGATRDLPVTITVASGAFNPSLDFSDPRNSQYL